MVEALILLVAGLLVVVVTKWEYSETAVVSVPRCRRATSRYRRRSGRFVPYEYV